MDLLRAENRERAYVVYEASLCVTLSTEISSCLAKHKFPPAVFAKDASWFKKDRSLLLRALFFHSPLCIWHLSSICLAEFSNSYQAGNSGWLLSD